MKTAPPSHTPLAPASRWCLTVDSHLGHTGTLTYSDTTGIVCRVALGQALTTFLLALVASYEHDSTRGITENVGCRTPEQLGSIVASMPGSGNAVAAGTIGGYKRALIRRVRTALKELDQAQAETVPIPVVNPRWGHGYCLAGPIEVRGV